MPKAFRSFLFASSVGLLVLRSLLFIPVSPAAEYPTKTIQIINPFPAGASTDILARILTDKLSALLGQPVVVINKTGGGGAIGIKAVKDAPADGHTVMVAPPPLVLIPIARKGIGFSLGDFTPINLAGSSAYVMVVKKEAPWKTLEEIVADAKKNPGKIIWAIPLTGSAGHFTYELFKMITGTDITNVPMGGETPVATAILGGHADTTFISLGTVNSHLQAGTLRALAFTHPKRVKEFPEIPTTAEAGYPKVNTIPWFVFAVHAKTPQPIVNKLSQVFQQALKDKEIIAKIEKAGMIVENRGAEETGNFLAGEHKKWSEVARVGKIAEQ
jgi:tripartite-type tricarboxylate transporter receptor subunit TctC